MAARPALPVELTSHASFEWKPASNIDRARHRTDFEILSVLGKGTFGTTYKVRNRIDSRIYAMKTIRLEAGIVVAGREKVLREVQVLSGIDSAHVVRYYAAWIEKSSEVLIDDLTGTVPPGSMSGEWGCTSTERSSSQDGSDDDGNDDNGGGGSGSGDDHGVCNLCDSNYSDWEVSMEQWGLIDAVLQVQMFHRCSIEQMLDLKTLSDDP